MKKFSLKWRIIIPIALLILLGVALMAFFISLRFSNAITENMENYLEAESYRYGNSIKADLEASFSGVKALAATLSSVAGSPGADREQYLAIIREVCLGNKGFFGLWTIFEPNKWDGRDAEYVGKAYGDAKNGRFSPYIFEVNGQEGTEWLADYEGEEGEYYETPRDLGHPMVSSPYLDTAGGQDVYVASAAVPIKQNDVVIGVAGADLNLDLICDSLAQVKILESGYAVLLDQSGIIVHHPDKALRSAPVYDHVPPQVASAIKDVYDTNQAKTVEAPAKATGLSTLFIISPFTVADTGSSWLLILAVPTAEVMAPVYSGLHLIIAIGAGLVLAAVLLLYLLASSVTRALGSIIQDLEKTSGQVNMAASHISASSQSLADGATTQAASLEETAASLEEISSMTKQSAENAAQANSTVDHTSGLFNDGARHMEDMTRAMSEISASAEQISRIIKTIEEIAFQTNLLALNAAVEAARAGEAGAGFAVVADEVRNLAGRTAQSVNDTTDLIQSTMRNVQNGVKVADDLSESFKEIQLSSDTIAALIREIDRATDEQAQGAARVNSAVSQMDQVVQQNAASSEESASAAIQLSKQATHLNEMVEELVSLVSGSSRA